MSSTEQLIGWILNNKQVGDTFSFEKDGELYWSSVAIQKWRDIFKVYVDEILDSQMAAENYFRDEILIFENIEEAIEFISTNTMSSPERLKPCKGQKIFNPNFSPRPK